MAISHSYVTNNQHSCGKSPINGGFNAKIIYKWDIFHGYVTNNQRVNPPSTDDFPKAQQSHGPPSAVRPPAPFRQRSDGKFPTVESSIQHEYVYIYI